ncbi:MAG: hypothetical protein IT377_00605 [Polyangiaceae bacterium]|nr:hypothetical protein [Polyangiaceae bacterium]
MAERARWVLGLLIAGGCAGAPPEPRATPVASASSGPVRPTNVTADPRPRLEITLSPQLSPGPVVRVAVVASGPPLALRRLAVARAAPTALSDVRARDAQGPLVVESSPSGDGVALAFDREPVPPLSVSYTRAAEAFSTGPLGVSLDPNRMAASGDALLALPVAWADQPVPTTVVIEAKKLLPEARAASSLGVGERRTLEVSSSALGRMTFLAGQMGHAVLDGPEGHDEVAWLGYTSFDPRSIAAEVASFRTAAREYLGDKRSAPFTLLLVSDARPSGGFEVARQTASVVVHVGVGQAYGGPMRVAVAHQLLREWLGPVLWVGPAEPERRAEAAWFVEGVTRFLARELAFRFGLLTPGEYLAEIDEIERLLVTSPDAQRPLAEVARAGAGTLLVARGARHAASADARIRSKSGGTRSLDHVLRALYAQAIKTGGPLPESAWSAALEGELGAAGSALVQGEVGAGTLPELPGDALGPCFAAGPKKYAPFDLGFELDGDSSRLPATVRRVAGHAARAGLRAGDRILSVQHQPGSIVVPVRLEIERAGQKQRVEYRPVGADVTARGFTRLARVPDDRCVRR